MKENLELFSYFLAVLALAGLIISRRDVAEAWRRGSRIQAMAAQVLVTGGMLSAATFVDAKLPLQIATLAVFAALLVVGALGGRPEARRVDGTRIVLPVNDSPAVALLLLWVWLYLVNLVLVPDELFEHAAARLGSGLALFVFLIAQRHHPIAPLQFYSASLITVVVIIVLLPAAPEWFSRCGRFKCNGVEAILQGPFESGNLLGLSAAMCAAFLLMNSAGSLRSLTVLFCLLPILYATMARTSLLAVGMAFALFTADQFVLRGRIPHLMSRFAPALAALTAALLPLMIGMFLVFQSSVDAFSARGVVWAKGRDAVWGYVVTGRGVDRWQVLADTSYFGSGFEKFMHSQYLLIYFGGGLVGLSLFAFVVFRITYVGVRIENSIGRGSVVPLTFAICGMVETVWNPLAFDAGTWIFFAVVSIAYPRVSAGPRTTAQAEESWKMSDRDIVSN